MARPYRPADDWTLVGVVGGKPSNGLQITGAKLLFLVFASPFRLRHGNGVVGANKARAVTGNFDQLGNSNIPARGN